MADGEKKSLRSNNKRRSGKGLMNTSLYFWDVTLRDRWMCVYVRDCGRCVHGEGRHRMYEQASFLMSEYGINVGDQICSVYGGNWHWVIKCSTSISSAAASSLWTRHFGSQRSVTFPQKVFSFSGNCILKPESCESVVDFISFSQCKVGSMEENLYFWELQVLSSIL